MAPGRIVKCPACGGTGRSGGKPQFRFGVVRDQSAKQDPPEECPRCAGDGLVWEPVNLPPPA
jgi:hypothetical protein